MKDRTFTVKTRNGEIFEIENAISEDYIRKTSQEIKRIKKNILCHTIVALIVLVSYFAIIGRYIGRHLKKRIYLSGPSKENGHYHIKALFSNNQYVGILLLVIAGALLIATFYVIHRKAKERLRQNMHIHTEQTLRCHVVERIQNTPENELAIEFERNALGDPIITVVTKRESYVLSENLHRIPKTDDKNNRLRFLTNELYYFKTSSAKKTDTIRGGQL